MAASKTRGAPLEKRVAAMVEEMRADFETGACVRSVRAACGVGCVGVGPRAWVCVCVRRGVMV